MLHKKNIHCIRPEVLHQRLVNIHLVSQERLLLIFHSALTLTLFLSSSSLLFHLLFFHSSYSCTHPSHFSHPFLFIYSGPYIIPSLSSIIYLQYSFLFLLGHSALPLSKSYGISTSLSLLSFP